VPLECFGIKARRVGSVPPDRIHRPLRNSALPRRARGTRLGLSAPLDRRGGVR
jgi:hypothetical protein